MSERAIDEAAAVGFGRGADDYVAGPPQLPVGGLRPAGRRARSRPGQRTCSTWRPAPGSSPGPRGPRGRGRGRRTGRRDAGRSSWPAARTSTPGTARPRPSRSTTPRRRWSPSARPSTGSTPRPPWPRSRRVLRPGGGLAMIWNVRDETVDWVRELGEIKDEVDGGPPYRHHRDADWEGLVDADGGYDAYTEDWFPNWQDASVEIVVGRTASTSWISGAARRPSGGRARRRAGAAGPASGDPGPGPVLVPPRHRRAVVPPALIASGGPRLVGRRPPGPAVAPDPGPVGRAGLRGDAPADPGGSGHPQVDGLPGSLPDPARCAAAPVGAVIEAWAGLGYNRRGVALHRCARVVVDEHGGRLPMDLAALLALPGIGPYTARAVLAFAGEQDVAVVDTNVARVLARQAGRPLPAGGGPGRRRRLGPERPRGGLGTRRCSTSGPRCAGPVPRTATGAPSPPAVRWRGGAGPDPAVGSAGVSGRQSRFEGSDRQGRGRLVDALRHGPVS